MHADLEAVRRRVLRRPYSQKVLKIIKKARK